MGGAGRIKNSKKSGKERGQGGVAVFFFLTFALSFFFVFFFFFERKVFYFGKLQYKYHSNEKGNNKDGCSHVRRSTQIRLERQGDVGRRLVIRCIGSRKLEVHIVHTSSTWSDSEIGNQGIRHNAGIAIVSNGANKVLEAQIRQEPSWDKVNGGGMEADVGGHRSDGQSVIGDDICDIGNRVHMIVR